MPIDNFLHHSTLNLPTHRLKMSKSAVIVLVHTVIFRFSTSLSPLSLAALVNMVSFIRPVPKSSTFFFNDKYKPLSHSGNFMYHLL